MIDLWREHYLSTYDQSLRDYCLTHHLDYEPFANYISTVYNENDPRTKTVNENDFQDDDDEIHKRMKTDGDSLDEQQSTKAQFERLGLFLQGGSPSQINSSLVEYTKNWKHLSFGLVLKQVIRLHTQWIEDEKMMVDDDHEEQKRNGKKKKTPKTMVLDKKNIPEEFHNDSELLKYWLQRYRLFSKFDEGIVLDRGAYIPVLEHTNR